MINNLIEEDIESVDALLAEDYFLQGKSSLISEQFRELFMFKEASGVYGLNLLTVLLELIEELLLDKQDSV